MEQIKRDEITSVKAPESRDGYPDFLFNPLFNTYEENDQYWSLQDSTNPRVVMIRNTLKTKYNRFEDYVKALELYCEYMEELAKDYGGMQILLNTIEEGNVTEYVPPEPRIKATKRSKKELRRIYKFSQSKGFDYDALNDILGDIVSAEENKIGENLSNDTSVIVKRAKGKEKREIQKIVQSMEVKNRVSSIYSRNRTSPEFDMISEYYRQLYENGGYTRKGKEAPLTFEEFFKRKEAEEIEREAFPDGRVESELNIFINGEHMPAARAQTIEFLKELYLNGYNVVGAFSKGMKKQEVRVIKRKIGIVDDDTMSKKMKKKAKKNKKFNAMQREKSGALLSKILSANGMNISDIDDEDVLGMTYENVMKGRYK